MTILVESGPRLQIRYSLFGIALQLRNAQSNTKELVSSQTINYGNVHTVLLRVILSLINQMKCQAETP